MINNSLMLSIIRLSKAPMINCIVLIAILIILLHLKVKTLFFIRAAK